MNYFTNLSSTLVCALVLMWSGDAAALSPQDDGVDPDVRAIEQVLYGRPMGRAVADLRAMVERDPANATFRFGLGIAEFLQSAETWFSAMYRHGLDFSRGPLMMALPQVIPPALQNPNPEPLSHEQFREIVSTWIEGVQRAQVTLAEIEEAGDLRLPLRVGLIALDFNGNGAAELEEALWWTFGEVQRRFDPEEQEAREFVIAFDRGDVNWLRGYCHILTAVGNLVLAYDTSELFDHTAHLFFPRAEIPYDYLKTPGQMEEWGFVDLAAFVHLLNLPVADAERSLAARAHLLDAVAQAQEMWTWYDREIDNDREWLPNPNQQSVIPNAVVDEERRDLWLDFLEEAKLVLEGERLLRFWRTANWMDMAEGRGVNLMRVLEEPRQFDLILWIQGPAAESYLEEGTLTEPQLWTRLNAAFDQGVFRYAFWFN